MIENMINIEIKHYTYTGGMFSTGYCFTPTQEKQGKTIVQGSNPFRGFKEIQKQI
jgi:hypothetical protein